MKYGSFPVEAAVGLVLGHTVRGTALLKKGHVVTPADVEMLKAGGIAAVIGARLDADDIGEDAAAGQIAAALAAPQIQASPAHTGRCNLIAGANGVMLVEKSAVDAANTTDESVTIATLPHFAAVRTGQIVATVKIIPFAVSGGVLGEVKEKLGQGGLRLAPYRAKKFALISTLLPSLKPSVIASTEEIARQRIAEINGTVTRSARIAHDSQAVAGEIRKAVEGGAEIVLVVGASATADREDVAPAGIVAAGGVIDHFGMPVDPGNLLVLARVGACPVLVLPGCARSPKLNGVDWVMQRLAADIPVTGRDIMAMGVGGLLVDTPSRPLPRAQAVQKPAPAPKSKIAAVVLAAGQSRRMGGRNKLLMNVAGIALVRRTVNAILASPVSELVVVTGHEPEKVTEALHGLNVRIVHNPRYAEGLSTSLKAGLDAVGAAAAGAIICLGDMPDIAAKHVGPLIAGFDPEEGREIGVPTHNGKRGNPVLWGRRFFQEIHEISGDVGARHLIGANESLVYEVEFEDTGVLMDLDTPGQWDDYLSSSPPRE
ncbi:MAG: NTP transferase domain-containing protein [Rhodospirillaceae bacterium]